MNILVLSDIHGRRDRVAKVLNMHRRADAVLFLGDGIRDISYEDCMEHGRWFAGVRENCDMMSHLGTEYYFSEELLLNLDAYTVMMTHGHRYSVKSGSDRMVAYAAERGTDLLLYGHTHVAEERYLPEGTQVGGVVLKKPMWILNPGSLGEPRGGRPSYGLIEIRNHQLLLSHGTL